MAGHAFDLEIRPVDVHEPLEGKPASLVEAIDVLCDQEVNAARPGERGERVVGGIRAGCTDDLPGLSLVAPVALARGLAREELRQWHRLVALPAPARRAEVGDARARGEAGAREDHHATGHSPPARQRLDLPHPELLQRGSTA